MTIFLPAPSANPAPSRVRVRKGAPKAKAAVRDLPVPTSREKPPARDFPKSLADVHDPLPHLASDSRAWVRLLGLAWLSHHGLYRQLYDARLDEVRLRWRGTELRLWPVTVGRFADEWRERLAHLVRQTADLERADNEREASA